MDAQQASCSQEKKDPLKEYKYYYTDIQIMKSLLSENEPFNNWGISELKKRRHALITKETKFQNACGEIENDEQLPVYDKDKCKKRQEKIADICVKLDTKIIKRIEELQMIEDAKTIDMQKQKQLEEIEKAMQAKREEQNQTNAWLKSVKSECGEFDGRYLNWPAFCDKFKKKCA